MIKKGVAITAIFIFSIFIQLISQIVVTRIFGATLDLDIFLAAVTIPTIAVSVIYGTLNDAFLPLYAEKKIHHPHQAQSYFFTHLLVFTLISFILASITGFFVEPISDFLYHSRGESFVLNVGIQMYYLSFSLPLTVIATFLGTYYYAEKNFFRFPLAQLVGSLANLGIIYVLAPSMGIWALVFAFVINIFFQILCVVPQKIWQFKLQPINIGPLVLAWIPLIVGTFALRSDTLLIRSFGSHLPAGSLVHLNLISKIFSLATGVMTIGIQTLLLPHLIEYLTKKEYDKAIMNIQKAKIIAVGVSVVVTIFVALISPLVVNWLFVGGKFSQKDAQTTISLIPLFILPAIGWGVSGVFFQPLLALKKQTSLGILNTGALILAWVGGILVERLFGPLPAITFGLIVLLFTGIIGSEILWQKEKSILLTNK